MMKAMKILIMSGAILSLGLYGCQQAAEREMGEARPGEEQEYGWGAEADLEEMKVAEGQLVRVEPDNQTLVIMKADGTEMQFSFDNQTQILGAQTTIQGLASAADARVVIHYEEGFVSDTAKKIEVQVQGSY